MQLSNIPGKLVLPFANAGGKSTIPVASQIGITAGAASLTDGFPPLTRTPVAAGGVPPAGLDMNGILYEMSAIIRWANAGGGYPFDGTFATDTNVGGYPKGARIMRSDGTGYWFNTAENNVTDPEGAGAVAAGWVPDFTTGVVAVTMTSANVTLNPLQYGKPIVVITGALTSDLNLIFPAIANQWAIINRTTGNHTITAKTATGVGALIPQNYLVNVVNDGLDITSEIASFALSSGSSHVGFTQGYSGSKTRTLQDKEREVISLLDGSGVTGDGVTGDGNAINTWLTTLDNDAGIVEVVIPRGNYLIDANLSIGSALILRFQPGAKFIIPTGITLSLSGVEINAGRQQIFQCTGTGKVSGTINNDLIFPEWWGAIANGIAAPTVMGPINTPAIQAALNFAGNQYATTGLTGTVCLTWGGYVTNATITIPLSANLIGYGIGSSIHHYAPTGSAVVMQNTNNSLVSDIFIAPLPGPTWNYSTDGYGLVIDNVSTPCVRNVWSSGFGAGGFYINSSIEGRIYGLIVDNSNGPSFVIRGVGQGTVIENCITAGNKNGPCFDIQSGYDWTLANCTAKDGTGGTHGFYLNACEDVNLIGCGTYGINRDGFQLTASTLRCNVTSCWTYDSSSESVGTYYGFNISGTQNKLTACKVGASAGAKYSYGIFFGGGATDCTSVNHTITSGVNGTVLDAQPTGSNSYNITKVSTTNATPVAIWKKSINNNCGCVLEATVVAKQRGATGATATYKFWTYVRTNTTNTALLSGPTSIYSYESLAGLDATFVLSDATANAGVVSLQVTGTTGSPVDWEATVNVISVTG